MGSQGREGRDVSRNECPAYSFVVEFQMIGKGDPIWDQKTVNVIVTLTVSL